MTGIMNIVAEMPTAYSVIKKTTLLNSVKYPGWSTIMLIKKPNKRPEAEVNIEDTRRVAPTLS